MAVGLGVLVGNEVALVGIEILYGAQTSAKRYSKAVEGQPGLIVRLLHISTWSILSHENGIDITQILHSSSSPMYRFNVPHSKRQDSSRGPLTKQILNWACAITRRQHTWGNATQYQIFLLTMTEPVRHRACCSSNRSRVARPLIKINTLLIQLPLLRDYVAHDAVWNLSSFRS